MSKDIIFIGGGGHAKVLIELVRAFGEYNIVGILDPQLEVGTYISGVSVLGNDNLLPELYIKGIRNVSIAIGSIKDNSKRKILYEKVKQIGFSVPCLIHPKAVVSGESQVSEGVQIIAGAIVQPNSILGENTIINTGAIIEHDCKIGKHVHICPGAVIAGGCVICEGAFIGAGATVIQEIRIGKNTIVGAGSVVTKDVPDGMTVMGVPAE